MKQLLLAKWNSGCTFKPFLFILGIAILVFIHILVYQNIDMNRIQINSSISEEREIFYPSCLESSEDYISQYFVPDYMNMISIKIRLSYNQITWPGEQQVMLRVTLKDEEANILQMEEVSSSDIENYDYYTFELKNELKQFHVYSITLEQISGQKDEVTGKFSYSFLPLVQAKINDQYILKESVYSEYNGMIQDYEWDVIYTYKILDNNKIGCLLLIDFFGILVLISFTKYLSKNNSKVITVSLLFISPILNFLLCESIVGNLFKIEGSYILLNLFINYLLLGIIILLFKTTRTVLLFNTGFIVVISLVEYYVYKLRGRSFMLQDITSLKTATTVMGAYSFDMEVQIGIALIITLIFFYIIMLIPNLKLGRSVRKQIIGAIATCMILGIVLSDNRYLSRFPAFSLDLWDIEANYQKKGFLVTLLAESQYLKNSPPEGYSVNVISDDVITITDNYENDVSSLITPNNLFVIMNESWADFRCIGEFEQQDTITPFMDELSENVIKGFLHMPVFGAGTANSEYEVLTGNSMQFINPSSIAYQLYISDPEWGMTTTLKQQGYKTFALHPNGASNWNRNIVYSKMQFDSFISSENWLFEQNETLRWYTNDISSFNALIDIYQSKDRNDKVFSFLVTMQNHGGYDWKDYKSSVNLNYEEEYPLTEQYLSLIKETDKAFAYLIDYFEDVEDPTMVVMFGDHLPNVETSFYEMLFNSDWNDIELEDKQNLYKTPYIIWTNYDISEIEMGGVEMSSNYFGSYILQLAGLKLTDYNKCLLNFMEEMPVIGSGMVKDSKDNWYKIEEMPESLVKIYQQYYMLEYNNIFGNKKRVDSVFGLVE